MLSSFLLQVSAESEIVPGMVPENDSVPSTSHSLVGEGSSGTSLQPMVTETGKINLSVDGLGTDSNGTIQVEKPAGATVKSAYLMAANVPYMSQISSGDIILEGSIVNWDSEVLSDQESFDWYNYWADVTSIVKPIVDAAPDGRVNLTLTEAYNSSAIDGEALAVIFDDPNQEEDNTVILLFGGQNPAGDTFRIKLSEPVDKNDSNFAADMGLGISFSYQNNGVDQSSKVEVNGVKITSSAGGEDDGYSSDGGLITVGGLDDSTENPADPTASPSNPRTDDELYDLLPLISDGDTNITVLTQNPSNNDNIFFAYMFLKSTTAMVGEGIILSPASGYASVGSQYTLSSVLQDDDGNPLSGEEVNFSVISGPNAGQSSIVTTNQAGKADFTYSDTSEGADIIKASFVNESNEVVESNSASVAWIVYPITSERTLSKTSVYPGEEFTVNLSVESDRDLNNLTVVEDLPEGWTLTPIDNASAEFDSSSCAWVWYNFSTGSVRQIVYTLKAPLDSDFGSFELEGSVLAENLVTMPVEGESEITVTPVADYNPKDLKLLHVSDPDQEFNISTHVLCNFTWYVNGKESPEETAENNASAFLSLSPEDIWENENLKNNYTNIENSSLFAGKYSVIGRVSNGSAAINQTWNFLITSSAESKTNINNTVVLPVREVEANESVAFNFTEDPDNTDDNSILAISFNASSAGNVSVFVEVLKDRASEVSEDSEGEVYQYINIHISNQTVVNETGSDSKFIDFKVSRAWVETVVQGTVRLNRYHNGEWQSLNTWETGSDANYSYFRAETPGFSPFSVTAEKISTSSTSTSHNGGSGTGSATIISSTEVEDGSVSGAESGDADSTLSKGANDTLVSQNSDSGKSVFVEGGNNSEALGSEENKGSEKSGSVGVICFILLILLIVGAYLVYRQTKEEK